MLILYNSSILYYLMKCDSIESLTSPMNAVETQKRSLSAACANIYSCLQKSAPKKVQIVT